MKSRWEQLGIPNPGSDDAFMDGCTCARIDNHAGGGFVLNNELVFFLTVGCPVHLPVADTAPL